MQAHGVVPALDKAEAGHARLGLECEPATVEQLALKRCEAALAHGVVIGVANRAHRGPHASFLAAFAERQGGILASLIAIMDHVAGAALTSRHLQRIHDQLGAQMGGHPHAPVGISYRGDRVGAEFTLHAGERLPFALSYTTSDQPDPPAIDAEAALLATRRFWRDWIGGFDGSRTRCRRQSSVRLSR